MKLGITYAIAAYALWGLFPLYFNALQQIAPFEILLHRIVWALAFLIMILLVRRQWSWLTGLHRAPRVLASFAASALLLSFNWYIYIWAVKQGRVIDASLGYFINPLVSVLLGCLLLQEKLRPGQWSAVALAAFGVAWLTWHAGQPPWIGLMLAASFGGYGLLRKIAVFGALEGLALETMILFPLALASLAFLAWQEQSAFLTVPATLRWYLVAAGPITAIPLLLFAASARRIPLSLLGILQYIGPTLQFIIGIWIFQEPFSNVRLVGFVLIWLALAVYSFESLWQVWWKRR